MPRIPPTEEEIMKKKVSETRLQESETKKTDSSSHCLAWEKKACLFQRATGTTRHFHGHIKENKWVQCSSCNHWLHFECAGVEADCASKDFFCGCNIDQDVDDILECVKAEEILKDEEIKDLERKQQSGQVLSNRMYLWKHRGFDEDLRKFYSEHFTLFSEMKTEQIIQRLDSILSVPGSEKQQFIAEVILPEVLIEWLQRTSNMCRHQAECLLLEHM